MEALAVTILALRTKLQRHSVEQGRGGGRHGGRRPGIFLARKRRAEIPVYQQALTEGNFNAIRSLGHKMKGTGAGYGFPMLTELGSIR